MDDIASSFYALAQWMRLSAVTRGQADDIAGEDLPGCRPACIPKDEEAGSGPGGNEGFKFDNVEIEGLVERERIVRAPLFNLTDGSGQTQEDIGKVIEKVFGIKVDYVSIAFSGLFISQC